MKTEHSLTTEQLSILEFCIDPQSFDSIKNFINAKEKETKQIIKLIKRQKLLEEVKGPTYNYLQISKKGKDLLQI